MSLIYFTMSMNEKDPNLTNLCKIHAARGDKDLYRLCPSKLNRRELEDLYYKLLESNLELKQTVNSQNQKNRMLTTKLQRVTAQNKAYLAKEPKNCCAGAKAVIAEQRASIEELKKANECMAERIKRLNVRLCTAKQFLKRSPSQANKCNALTGTSTSVKNLSTSALGNQNSAVNLISTVVSPQTISRNSSKMKSVETNTEVEIHNEKLDVEKVCDENKCRSTMEEFKHKITNLQDELLKTHDEYAGRMSQLEQRVCQLQEAKGEQEQRARFLREAQAQRVELEMQLTIEKQKVAELEMRLLSANMSQEIANTIAEHLANTNQLKEKCANQNGKPFNICQCCVTSCPPTCTLSPPKATTVSKKANELTVPDDKQCRSDDKQHRSDDTQYRSDDSGYADQRDSDQGSINKANQELANRVAYLQAQLDAIKITASERGHFLEDVRRSSSVSYEVVVDKPDVPVLKNVKNYSCVIIDPSKKVIVEIDHVNKDSEPEVSIDRDAKLKEETQNVLHRKNSEDQKSHQCRGCDKVGLESALSSKNLDESKLNSNQTNETLKGIHITDSRIDINEKTNAKSLKEDSPEQTRSNIRDMSQMYKKQDSLNDETKPLQENDSMLQRNLSWTDKKQTDKNLDSVLPSKQLETNVACKSKVNVICECPKCDDDPVKIVDKERDSLEIHERKAHRSTSHEVKAFQEDEYKMEGKPSQKALKLKPDRHNSLQIPGPLPVNPRDSNTSKNTWTSIKNKSLQESKAKNGIKEAGINKYEDKVLENEKPGVMKEEKLKAYAEKDEDFGDPKTIRQNRLMNEHNQGLKGSINKDINKPNTGRYPNEGSRVDSFDVQKGIQNTESIGDQRNESKETKTVKEHVKCLNERICCRRDKGAGRAEARIEICSRRAPICTCPQTVRRSLAICRTCSGTRTFQAKPDGAVLKRCHCANKAGFFECGNKLQDPEPSADRISSPPNSDRTYTVPGTSEVNKCSRASSPENTEREISSLSDLPTENGTSPRVLSPGEHKETTTYSTTYRDSYSPNKNLTLSEGEVPNEKYRRKRLSISVGEQPNEQTIGRTDFHNPESSAVKMEAALQAISQELARCRTLLQSQRARERLPYKDAETITSSELGRDSIILRKAEGKSRISRTIAPKCIFTLHIGTIVLSDEAVINARSATQMLMWKFFDQNVAMTRMTPARVVHFDFSTEYEVKITEEFVNYLKHEEMPIRICELDAKETPFATCTLPLREALLNANRRVDLSLALVSRPLVIAQTTDSLDMSDEIGVLDVWCMLRAESRTLAFINRAISATSVSSVGAMPALNKLSPIIDEDQSYDNRLSQDLDMRMTTINKQKLERLMPERALSVSMGAHSNALRHHIKPNELSLTSNLGFNSAETRRLMNNAQKFVSPVRSPVGSASKKLTQRTSSGIILAEVTPKVRTSSKMIHYLENLDDTKPQSFDQNAQNWRTKRNSAAKYELGENTPFQKLATAMLRKNEENCTMSTDTVNGEIVTDSIKKVTIDPRHQNKAESSDNSRRTSDTQSLDITVLWLALNEECEVMLNPRVRRLYVAYSFLGRDGAELETPFSLPKPKHYLDKCFFNFKKTFYLTQFDMPILERMAQCRSRSQTIRNTQDCIVFTVVSEPPEDPLGLDNCEDIGYAYLYLGDLLAYCPGDTFTEVLPVRTAHDDAGVCGVLAVKLDGLDIVRACAFRKTPAS